MILRRIDIKKAIVGLLALTIVSLITAISPAHAQEAVQSVTVSSDDAALDKSLSDNPSIILAHLELEKSKLELEKKKRELKKLKDADESDERDIEILEKQIYYSELLAGLAYEDSVKSEKIKLSKAIYDYAYSGQMLALKREASEYYSRLSEEARKKLELGYVSRLDYSDVLLSHSQKVSELADAQISFDSAMHELNIILGNSLDTQISAVEGFAISNYDIDAIDAAAVTARAQRADSSIANLESSAETSRLEYEKQVAYYTEINLNAKILKATYDKNLESLEQAKKEIEKDVVESVASLKNSRQQLALQKESIDNQKKRFEAKSKEFELGHASLNELQEQYLSLQEKMLSYYQSIYQYNIDIMNFVSTYGG
ncbi:MAG: TolC family protein [Peptoclostridium sp.]|uniref:TolC family protein n=1 Tax=Peptoclostridium sp. TaxID=1904860 RepID=UPI00139D3FF4|nr:TolC family protein [Peptoclostridium sp.]MZQ76353.1 TolC family protein [Peptoclostridium sp.]